MHAREDRREALIDRMADHVLSYGLAAATLRPLAAAVGTSDRMLLYYFTDKDELVTAVLDNIAGRLLKDLETAIPIEPPRSYAILLEEVWAVLGSASHRPFLNIWLDLAAGAARGMQPHLKVAGSIADLYLDWVTVRLVPEANDVPSHGAPLLFATIQGMNLLNAIGRPAIASAASHSTLRPH